MSTVPFTSQHSRPPPSSVRVPFVHPIDFAYVQVLEGVEYFVVGANTKYYAPLRESGSVQVYADGYWGPDEYIQEPQPLDRRFPYLAAVPIDPGTLFSGVHQLYQRPHRTLFVPSPSRPGSFILNAYMHDEWEKFIKLLGGRMAEWRSDFELRKGPVERFISSTPTRAVQNDYMGVATVGPDAMFERMWDAQRQLHVDGLRSMRDLFMAYRALQRATRELFSFFYWFEMSKNHGKESTRKEWLSIAPASATDFRGVILEKPEDISLYPYFKDLLKLPVYVKLRRSQWTLPDAISLVAPSPLRSSIVGPGTLGTLNTERELPLAYYPPPVRTADFEGLARGIVPRTDAWNPSPQILRRLKIIEAEREAMTAEIDKRPRTQGYRLGQWMQSNNPAIRQLLDLPKRPGWMPQPVPLDRDAAVEVAVIWNAEPLAMKYPVSYYPPEHVLYGAETRAGAALRTLYYLRLESWIDQRVALTLNDSKLNRTVSNMGGSKHQGPGQKRKKDAMNWSSITRDDEGIGRLTAIEWKKILTLRYFQESVWPKEEAKHFKKEQFFRFGGRMFFGAFHHQLLLDGELPAHDILSEVPLDCHDALVTQEMLEQDDNLMYRAVYRAHHRGLLHDLIGIAAMKYEPMWEVAFDKYGEHRQLPLHTNPAGPELQALKADAEAVVGPVSFSFTRPWQLTYEHPERRDWVGRLRCYLVKHVIVGEVRYLSHTDLSIEDLRALDISNLSITDLQVWERRLVATWFSLVWIFLGKKPCALLPSPHVDGLRCSACAPPPPTYKDFDDLSDEDE